MEKCSFEATIFASFPVNTFLENIAVDDAGLLYITSVEEGILYRLNQEAEKEVLAGINGKLVGILYLKPGMFLLNGWDEQGISTIYSFSGGEIRSIHQPDGAQFLNGMAAINNRLVLICDSYKGCLWCYDIRENKSAVWLQDPMLSRGDPRSGIPAANGIKVFNDVVYVSNTERRILITIPLTDDRAGRPQLFIDRWNLDDFAFDEGGNIYATTHIFNSVVKITPQKEVTVIGGEAAGLAGSTAVAFGKTAADKNHIYITTNGGMSLPPAGGV